MPPACRERGGGCWHHMALRLCGDTTPGGMAHASGMQGGWWWLLAPHGATLMWWGARPPPRPACRRHASSRSVEPQALLTPPRGLVACLRHARRVVAAAGTTWRFAYVVILRLAAWVMPPAWGAALLPEAGPHTECEYHHISAAPCGGTVQRPPLCMPEACD